MPLFRRKSQEAIDPDALSQQLGVKYKDLGVLQQLMEAGADLTQPRHVLYFLYFDSEAAARQAEAEAASQGFTTDVREPLPDRSEWSLVCERHGVVTDPITVRDASDAFEALAHRHGGEYDGWEASV